MLVLAPLVFAFPQPWTGSTIRVFDEHTGWGSELRQATGKWNRARVGIRFVYVDSAAKADVIVQVRPSASAERAACHLPGTASVDACTDWIGRKPWGSALLMAVPRTARRPSSMRPWRHTSSAMCSACSTAAARAA